MSDPHQEDARIYPCATCGTLRTTAEGGTVFTVCDDCWHPIPALEAENARLRKLAKEATNGWACYATRTIEHDEIARLHREIDAVLARRRERIAPQ